ncbi:MAG: M14 family zinc carboxypeptidase [Candidatus Aminicenantia bacterium]
MERYLVRVRAEREKLAELSKKNFDFASMGIRNYMDLILSEEEIEDLIHSGYSLEILQRESELAGNFDPIYHTYEETVDFLQEIEKNYPHLSKLFIIGKSTRFGYPIYALKISDNVELDEDEIAILIDGMHHAREPLGNEICLSFIEYILSRYGIDEHVKRWVDSYEIWVIPILNPEGYKFLVDSNLSSPWWRKNLRDNNNNGKIDVDYDGVDLNRNYDINWTWGGSPNPWDWTYRGPYPFSENETRAKRELALRQKIIVSVTYHSYGEIVYYPWIWPGTRERAPEDSLLTELASEIAKRIKREDGTGTYTYERESASNMSPPWMYSVAGTLEFLIETGTSFFPSGYKINQIVNSNLDGLFYLMDRLSGSGVKFKVKDSKTNTPLTAQIKILGIDNFKFISPRMTDSNTGSLVRLLLPGKYSISINSQGYRGKLINLNIGKELEEIEISLKPSNESERKDESKRRF